MNYCIRSRQLWIPSSRNLRICNNNFILGKNMNLKFKKPSKETQMAMSKVASGDKGLIDLDNLDDLIISSSKDNIINLDDENNKSALFLTSFAAYTAEQDLEAICDFAHKNNILVVEDASGAIGDYENRLANGNYSDIIIGSTGSPKIVNVEDGGFITTNDDGFFDNSKLLLKTNKASKITACGIYNELDFAKDNLKKTIDACLYLKEAIGDETDFNVFHKDKRGINVIMETEDPKSLSYKLRQEFVLDSHGMITKCPNYNRLKEKAVTLEIKNLDIECLNQDNLDEIIKTLKGFDNK